MLNNKTLSTEVWLIVCLVTGKIVFIWFDGLDTRLLFWRWKIWGHNLASVLVRQPSEKNASLLIQGDFIYLFIYFVNQSYYYARSRHSRSKGYMTISHQFHRQWKSDFYAKYTQFWNSNVRAFSDENIRACWYRSSVRRAFVLLHSGFSRKVEWDRYSRTASCVNVWFSAFP